MLPSATVIRWGTRLAGWLPAGAARALARGAGTLAWLTWRTRRVTILGNMRFLVDDPAAQAALGARVMPNLLEAVLDLWRLPTPAGAEVLARVSIEGLENLRAALAAGRGVILATAHLGPYELAGAWLAHQGFPVHAMVERLDPETATAMAAYRTATGMQLIDRSTGTRAVLRALHAGEVAALVSDRMVGSGAPGQVVAFGRGEREIPTGPASLALATGARVVTGSIVRRAGARPGYVLALSSPIDPAGHTVPSLTALIGERLSAMVVAHPDEWYVFQPGWTRRVD